MNIPELRNNLAIAKYTRFIKHAEYMIAEAELTILQNQLDKWEAEMQLKSKIKEIEKEKLDGTN